MRSLAPTRGLRGLDSLPVGIIFHKAGPPRPMTPRSYRGLLLGETVAVQAAPVERVRQQMKNARKSRSQPKIT